MGMSGRKKYVEIQQVYVYKYIYIYIHAASDQLVFKHGFLENLSSIDDSPIDTPINRRFPIAMLDCQGVSRMVEDPKMVVKTI